MTDFWRDVEEPFPTEKERYRAEQYLRNFLVVDVPHDEMEGSTTSIPSSVGKIEIDYERLADVIISRLAEALLDGLHYRSGPS